MVTGIDEDVRLLGNDHRGDFRDETAPRTRSYPALYGLGVQGDAYAIWRSDDEGVSWMRINDTAHEYGRRFRCIAGDPRVFGRVYVGTDGQGIVYGGPQR